MPNPFIATKDITIDGARGYVPGDVVSDQVVKDHDLGDSVSREGTKAATEAAKPAETDNQSRQS